MNQPDRTAAIVYYDGSCPLCAWEIGHHRRSAGADQVTFSDISGQSTDPSADLSCRAAMARFHVRTPSGRLLSGAEAFAALWLALPGWRWLGRMATAPGALWFLERLYRGFLPLRPTLAKALRNRAS